MIEHAEPAAPMSPDDVYLFNEGTHERLYRHLGAHLVEQDGRAGVRFAVWAPNAERVSVVGDFNGWQPGAHPMQAPDQSGVWSAFVPGLGQGELYKYHVESRHNGYRVDKADPFAFAAQRPPNTASVVHPLDYEWRDDEWMRTRAERSAFDKPVSIYELHAGSWRRHPDDRRLTYTELADRLVPYLVEMGFTHVELLPVMHHPLYKSWGYQTTGYFAPSPRYGPPQELMGLIDRLHQAGVGVILDWVPSHFPSDEHALGYFDGTHLYEHADPRLGFHPDWKSLIFNYARHEVRAFLLSSAMFWLDKYHADGLRVDAVASMLYLDYSREPGEWIPNEHGGRENLHAIDFLRRLNTSVYRDFPGVQTYAEESTAWPLVTRPVDAGGLGFGYKWDMGWMHDTLKYFSRDPLHRKHHHHELTFRSMYAWSENYTLPLSHDEVVHLKGSILGKMPGDEWQKFANLRTLLTEQWCQPGKKLLFMGAEIGVHREWDEYAELEWGLLDDPRHEAVRRLVGRLNELYRAEPGLHELDCDPAGFTWLDADDADQSVYSFLRLGRDPADTVVCLFNCTPVPRGDLPVGLPDAGPWVEILNTDAGEFGGSGAPTRGKVWASPGELHGQGYRGVVTLPPLAALLLRRER